MFKLWSKLNQEAHKELKPDLGPRNWAILTSEEKYVIWKHLEPHFFDKNIKMGYNHINGSGYYYFEFFGDDGEQKQKQKRVKLAIYAINRMYKSKSKTYVPNYLENKTLNSACLDFYNLFVNGVESIVLELLSVFVLDIISERKDVKIRKNNDETESQYLDRLDKWQWEDFNNFAADINDVLDSFGLDVWLTRLGFGPKQEQKIEEEIYEPTLRKLSNPKWKEVNRDLSDAFDDFKKDKPDYSGCITHTISAIQAYLQIVVCGKIGKGDISDLVKEAKKKKLIPDDDFANLFFESLESYLARTRQEKGDPHPKKEYATEKNARLVLNLAMVFLEHCIL